MFGGSLRGVAQKNDQRAGDRTAAAQADVGYVHLAVRRERRLAAIELAPGPGAVTAAVLLTELHRVVADLEADCRVSVILLHGVWALPACADRLVSEDLPASWRDRLAVDPTWDDPQEPFSRCRKPVVAAISGDVSGLGALLLLACDLRIASDDARIRFLAPQPSAVPGSWLLDRLVKAVGVTMTLDWCLLRPAVDAQAAKSAGLILAVHPADKIAARGRELALEIVGESDQQTADSMRVGAWGERRTDVRGEHSAAPWDA